MPVQNEYGLQSGLYGAAGTEKADKNELAIKIIQGDLCITIMKWDIYICTYRFKSRMVPY